MLDVWRVSRIASHDILQGHAASGARPSVAETVERPNSLCQTILNKPASDTDTETTRLFHRSICEFQWNVNIYRVFELFALGDGSGSSCILSRV